MPCSFKAPAYWGNFIPAHWQKGCLFTWQYDGLLPTKSQAGQDLVILALSPLTENPLFLDVGANDGITGNSSLLLEQKGWKGLLVEPNISLLSSLLEFRTSSVLVGAVASKNGILNLATSNVHTLGTCLADDNSPEMQRLLHESGGACNIVYMPSASFTLETIYSYFIKSFSFPPTFLKLDIEGLEYSALACPPPGTYYFN